LSGRRNRQQDNEQKAHQPLQLSLFHKDHSLPIGRVAEIIKGAAQCQKYDRARSRRAGRDILVGTVDRSDQMMNAIVVREFGAPEVMQLESLPIPTPAECQLVVKIHAAGVNPVDTYLRTGNHAHAPKLPYTPGKDAAGVVAAAGAGVSRFKEGDRIYTAGSISGTYAEYSLCEERQVGHLPDNVSFEEGAAIWTPYATAYRALFQKASAVSGETVLVHGASGGVGMAAVQWAKNAGLRVIGTASSDEGRQHVLQQGAEKVFDHSADGYMDEIREQVGSVDIVVEMLANQNLENDFSVLAMFGRIVVVGNRGSLEFTPRLAMSKDATIFGMSLFNAPRAALDEIHSAIGDGLSAGYLRPVIGRRFPLSEAPLAHHAVIENKAEGKIVLLP
jgi:NADPH2:quinone reductase